MHSNRLPGSKYTYTLPARMQYSKSHTSDTCPRTRHSLQQPCRTGVPTSKPRAFSPGRLTGPADRKYCPSSAAPAPDFSPDPLRELVIAVLIPMLTVFFRCHKASPSTTAGRASIVSPTYPVLASVSHLGNEIESACPHTNFFSASLCGSSFLTGEANQDVISVIQ